MTTDSLHSSHGTINKADNITRAPLATHSTGSNPPASSGETFEAFGPVWTALMVATGWPQACSLLMLHSTAASTVERDELHY